MGESLRPYYYAMAASVVLLLGVGLWGYAILPDRIPTHFDLAGHAQAWGSKWSITIEPVIGAAALVILTVALKFKRRTPLPFSIREENVDKVNALSKEMHVALGVSIVAGMIALEIETVLAALAGTMPAAFLPTVVAMIAGVFGCTAYFYIRIYRASNAS